MTINCLKTFSLSILISLSVSMPSFALEISTPSDSSIPEVTEYTTNFNAPNDELLKENNFDENEEFILTDEQRQQMQKLIDDGKIIVTKIENTPENYRGGQKLTPGTSFFLARDRHMNYSNIEELENFLEKNTNNEIGDTLRPNAATVEDYSKCKLIMYYYDATQALDEQGNVKLNYLAVRVINFNSKGWSLGYTTSQLPSKYKLFGYHIEIPKGTVSPGKYRVKNLLYAPYSDEYYHISNREHLNDAFVKIISKKRSVALRHKVDTESQFINATVSRGLSFGCDSEVDITTSDYLYFEYYVRDSIPISRFFLDGDTGAILRLRFEYSSSNSAISFNDGYSEDYDAQNAENTAEMANGIAEIAQGQNAVLESMRELMQHISNQLFAFWNQLAGEFTNLYAKLEKDNEGNTNNIVTEIQNSTNAITNNQDKNTYIEIETAKENAENITNGYDNSKMNSSNDALNNQIAENEKAEKVLSDGINSSFNQFEFDGNILTKYLRCFHMIGEFLTALFENSGFDSVVRFSFFMGVAMLCIGMYRFKGGS